MHITLTVPSQDRAKLVRKLVSRESKKLGLHLFYTLVRDFEKGLVGLARNRGALKCYCHTPGARELPHIHLLLPKSYSGRLHAREIPHIHLLVPTFPDPEFLKESLKALASLGVITFLNFNITFTGINIGKRVRKFQLPLREN